MRIYKTINKVPGGLMVVPLFIGMVINTFFPHLLKIGGFTEALSNVGYPTILGMYLFTVGTKMTVRTAPRMLKRGFGIMAAKVGIATLIAVSVGKFFGGDLFGFSTLALLVAMSDTNGGMFMALTSVMGDKEDAGTYVPQSIETGPFLTMVILVGAGLANIPWLTMVSVIAPIAAGAVLGNLDEDLRDFFGSHEPIIVPFMAFTLGPDDQPVRGGDGRHPGRRAGRVRGGHHRRGLHPGRPAARRFRHRRRRRVEHRRQLGRGAEGGRHGGSDLRRHRADRDGAGGRLGHRHRRADADTDLVRLQARAASAGIGTSVGTTVHADGSCSG